MSKNKVCVFEGCVNNSSSKNLCYGHYNQQRRGTALRPIRKKATPAYLLSCNFSGCKNKQQAKGLCGGHWRQQNAGVELKTLQNQVPLTERIFEKVEKTEYCWIWHGRVSGKRHYPQISVNSKQRMVHRVVFEEMIRNLEPGETIDHLCRNTLCVNPEHLEAVPLRDNVKRMHAYRSLLAENKKLVAFIESLGYDSKTL